MIGARIHGSLGLWVRVWFSDGEGIDRLENGKHLLKFTFFMP